MPLFAFIFLYTIDTFIHHSFINIRWGPSPYRTPSTVSSKIKHSRQGPATHDYQDGRNAEQNKISHPLPPHPPSPPPQLNKSGLKLVCKVNIVNLGSADTTNETED